MSDDVQNRELSHDTPFQRVILVHYHEIGLKGKNRISFEMRLLRNLESLLDAAGVKYEKIQRISGRLRVAFPEDVKNENATETISEGASAANVSAAFEIIRNVPGIARVSQGLKCAQNLEAMIEAGKSVMAEAGGNNLASFKVNARRNHTSFETNSMEMNQMIGGALSDAFPEVKVQMKEPQLEVRVEVIQGASYVYGRTVPGVGGLPVGSSGRLVAMLSSGIDSPVALWKMARRGAVCVGVHFSGAPVVSNESEYLVREISEIMEMSGCIVRLYIARIGEYQKKIAEECPAKLRIILYRRFMYKIAEEIAKKEHAGALVTGESLGQVASQTLENLIVTDAAVDLPVLRPLIGSDKLEIIDRAISIGTFEISSEKAPDCCTLYMPQNPETHAKLAYVEQAEEGLSYDAWIAEILENVQVYEYRCCCGSRTRH